MDGKFSTKDLGKLPGQPAGHRLQILFTPKVGEQLIVCGLDHWGFDSCGINTLFGFSRDWNMKSWTKEFVQKFVKYLHEVHKDFNDDWKPAEFLFSVSDYQIGLNTYGDGIGMLGNLIQHPLVRQIDKFENKAHGPNDIHVFRLSLNKDFAFHEK